MSGSTSKILTRANVAAIKSANFHQISYRLRTELGMEVWHWNPRGHWSDAAHQRGYWTSDSIAPAPIRVSNGYKLPRRGNTIDQGNGDGYSRLTDGDTASFWKSNPYLDARYTHERVTSHPQGVIVDMDSTVDVNAIDINWGAPFATQYRVQYWPENEDEQPEGPDDDQTGAMWVNFAAGDVASGAAARGGNTVLQLAASPVRTRWIRILLLTSSHSAIRGSRDPRDSLGFAIRELSIGRMVNGSFRDISRHSSRASQQTRTYASSTDPWHRATDRDDDTEQPGIDAMFASGITRGLPMLTPVGVLYDTPANAAALLRYVRHRRYPVRRLELGEEPDGQFVSPVDFAALYVQAADSLRAVDPTITLGGPSLQDGQTKTMMSWKESVTDDRSWFGHFLDALAALGHSRDLAFASFEFYPYDRACTPTAPQLAKVAGQIDDIIAQFRSDGLPANVSLLMTEYGYSAFSTESEMSRAGAILNTVAVAEFLAHGGGETFFYGTEPSNLDRNPKCDSWGDNTLFVADNDRRILAPNATYQAGRMLTTLWADSSGGRHSILATTVTGETAGSVPLHAYAIRRPDNRVALLIVNRDPTHDWTVNLRGLGDSSTPLDVWRLSSAEYEWHPNRAHGFAKPNSGARKSTLSPNTPLVLKPYSIVVVREH
ncbi:MAG: discoidin domain-containing protein [Gemmatimonadaceae bacterium]